EGVCECFALHGSHCVVFNTDAFGSDALAVQCFLETVVEVVAAPIGVDDIVAVAGAPWHTGVNIGGYGNRLFLSHNQRVLTSEVREQEIRVVLDALVACENDCVEAFFGHDRAQTVEATFEFSAREGQWLLGAVMKGLETLEFADVCDVSHGALL